MEPAMWFVVGVSCVEFGGGDLALGRLRMCEQIIEDIDARYPNAKKEAK